MKNYDIDLLLYNARILTMSPSMPTADWIAVKKGNILALGNHQNSARPFSAAKRIIDCRGHTLLPGFVDAHLHLHAMAKRFSAIQVTSETGVRNLSDMRRKITQRAAGIPKGQWIHCEGYHEYDLAEKRHPHRMDLDPAAPHHPVKLSHRSGHAHVLNTLGLARVGISDESGDPPGGMIDRDLGTGLPSGLLYEMGGYLARHIPPLSDTDVRAAVKSVNKQLVSHGVTAVHDVSISNDIERVLTTKKWIDDGLLSPKISMAIGIEHFLTYGWPQEDEATTQASVCMRGVKIILDETTGRVHPDQELLNQWVEAVHRAGLQVIIHAIEEPAILAAVTAIEHSLAQLPRNDHRHRIEHCSICPPPLAKKIAALGIRVVSQPGFLYFSGDRYLETVPPEKIDFLYPFATFLKNGLIIAASSDAPVSPVQPLAALHSAVTRLSQNGKKVGAGETVDILQALKMFTVHSAEAFFGESNAGMLVAGRPADMIVLDGDLYTCLPDDINTLKVAMTLINGRIVQETH